MIKYFTIFLLVLGACNSNNENQITPVKDSITFLPIPKIENKEIIDTAFLVFWKEFTQVVKSSNQKIFTSIAADSLDCGADNEHGLTALNKFMATRFANLFDTALVNKFDSKDKIKFYDASFDEEYVPLYLIQQLKKGKDTTKEVVIEVSDAGDEPVEVTLKFIDTKNGYKFYGYDK